MLKKFSFTFLILGLCVGTAVFACSKELVELKNKDGLFIAKVNLKKVRLEPYLAQELETVDFIAKKTGASIAINSGFFDAKNKKTVSFITKDGKTIATPRENENLTSNPELQPHLEKIFNRGEFRILKCNDKIEADITFHNEPLEEDCELLNSTQAGPILLPNMDLEKEFFILKQDGKVIRDSIGVFRKTDRSLVAIKNNELYFIITEKDKPLTILELQGKIKNLGFEKALNFDGGGSVSLFAKTKDGYFYQGREKNDTSRPIKSAITIFPKQ